MILRTCTLCETKYFSLESYFSNYTLKYIFLEIIIKKEKRERFLNFLYIIKLITSKSIILGLNFQDDLFYSEYLLHLFKSEENFCIFYF